MRTELGVAGVVLMAAMAAAGEMRTWTFEHSGKTMQGEAVGFAGDSVTLKRPDGKTVSVKTAYLSESDRNYVEKARAEEWKEVEITSLEGTISVGRYRKCRVQGKVTGQILIQLLPPNVEATVRRLTEQVAQIEYLKSWIDAKTTQLRHAEAFVHDANLSDQNTYYYIKRTVWVSLDDAKEDLPKLQEAYAQSLIDTKAARTLKLKNTGFVYDGLAVWECADPRKPQR